MAFSVSTACSVSNGTTYNGADLPNGYYDTVLSWAECCSLCFSHTDCFAWTYKPGGTQPGCHLKGKTGYSLENLYRNHVSGTMLQTL